MKKIASAYGVSLANITFSKVSAPSVHWSSSSSSSSNSTTETTITQHITVQGLDHTLYTSGTNESTVKKVYTEAYTDSVGMSINGTLAKGNKITHKFAAARRASSKITYSSVLAAANAAAVVAKARGLTGSAFAAYVNAAIARIGCSPSLCPIAIGSHFQISLPSCTPACPAGGGGGGGGVTSSDSSTLKLWHIIVIAAGGAVILIVLIVLWLFCCGPCSHKEPAKPPPAKTTDTPPALKPAPAQSKTQHVHATDTAPVPAPAPQFHDSGMVTQMEVLSADDNGRSCV
jgi:hypothetical protein